MKLPRRQPRTVYAVYDAEELIEQGAEPASHAQGVLTDRENSPERSPQSAPAQPGKQIYGRMLVGALLCLMVGITAIVVLVIALRPDGQTEEEGRRKAGQSAARVSAVAHRPLSSQAGSAVATAVEGLGAVEGHGGVIDRAARSMSRTASRPPRRAMADPETAAPLPPRAVANPETWGQSPAATLGSEMGQGLAAGWQGLPVSCRCAAADLEFGFER